MIRLKVGARSWRIRTGVKKPKRGTGFCGGGGARELNDLKKDTTFWWLPTGPEKGHAIENGGKKA